MTGFEIHQVDLARDPVRLWSGTDPRLRNWPVVYTLDGSGQIYVGESLNVAMRFRSTWRARTRRRSAGRAS